jgi:hypothetical protein
VVLIGRLETTLFNSRRVDFLEGLLVGLDDALLVGSCVGLINIFAVLFGALPFSIMLLADTTHRLSQVSWIRRACRRRHHSRRDLLLSY